MEPGDVICFFTDGVTEGRRGSDYYGDDRLERLLAARAGRRAAQIADDLVDDVVGFQGGLPRDDIAIVVVKAPDEAVQKA